MYSGYGIALHAGGLWSFGNEFAGNVVISGFGSVSTNVTRNLMCNVSINVLSTASTDVHKKKVRYKMDCCILHTVILLFIAVIVC